MSDIADFAELLERSSLGAPESLLLQAQVSDETVAVVKAIAGGDHDAELTPIYGGFCVRRLDDDHCVDLLQMLYNWRLVVTVRPAGRPHNGMQCISRAWCYFGHGTNQAGVPRTMGSAFLAAAAAARVWDGAGDPVGADKRAGA